MTDDAIEDGTDGDDGEEQADADDPGAAVAGGFEADRERARQLLADEGVEGLYAGVVRGDELDYVFAHRFEDPERVGMQALGLLAQHVRAIAEEAELPPERVAEDAARLAGTLGAPDGTEGP